MRWQDHIERKPSVMMGKPVIKGTRITVELLVGKVAAGCNDTEILASYPHLKPEHIRAALAYAAESLSSDEVVFLSGNPT